MPERPNVVLVSTHDSGRHLGCYGVETAPTPNLDGLAEEGVRFTDFFTACPQCAPSRCSLLTGQHPQTNGMMGLPSDSFRWRLEEPGDHLSNRLREVGYETAHFGIQHEAPDASDLAFDHVEEEPRPGPEVAADAAEFVAAEHEDPFYAQIGLFETHEPLDFGGAEPIEEDGVWIPPYLEDNGAAREYLAQFQGALRQADEAVGGVLEGLEEAGLTEETLVVFTSDHGIPFSRAKGFCYDPGVGVPLLLRWPEGGIEGGETCEYLASTVDFVPTLLELIDAGPARDTEGLSLADGVTEGGTAGEGPRQAVFGMFHDHRRWGFGPDARYVRTRTHKLIRNFESGAHFELPIDLSSFGRLGRDGLRGGGTRPAAEYYDLESDPNEFENLAPAAEDRTLEALEGRLREHLERVGDPVLEGPVPSPFAESALADFKQS